VLVRRSLLANCSEAARSFAGRRQAEIWSLLLHATREPVFLLRSTSPSYVRRDVSPCVVGESRSEVGAALVVLVGYCVEHRLHEVEVHRGDNNGCDARDEAGRRRRVIHTNVVLGGEDGLEDEGEQGGGVGDAAEGSLDVVGSDSQGRAGVRLES